jgi:site-specific DNA-adenine methylase
MDLFIDWMTVERFLEWKEGIKQLQETTGKITDEDLIETYQDYRNSFKELYEEIDAKLDEILD